MDCIETATFKDQTEEEKDRLLHMVRFSFFLPSIFPFGPVPSFGQRHTEVPVHRVFPSCVLFFFCSDEFLGSGPNSPD